MIIKLHSVVFAGSMHAEPIYGSAYVEYDTELGKILKRGTLIDGGKMAKAEAFDEGCYTWESIVKFIETGAKDFKLLKEQFPLIRENDFGYMSDKRWAKASVDQYIEETVERLLKRIHKMSTASILEYLRNRNIAYAVTSRLKFYTETYIDEDTGEEIKVRRFTIKEKK